VLIIVPPSETKRRPPDTGPPVDFAQLSFPELDGLRRDLVDALIETSADLDAFDRLRVGPTLAHEVATNAHLRDVPALPAAEVYTGPLHEGFAADTLSRRALELAQREVVIVSPLWGLLRVADRIPPYRLGLMSRLLGFDRLDHVWRDVLPAVLATAAGDDGPVVDLRSRATQAMGMPAVAGGRVVSVRVDQGTPGNRLGDVIAKRVRGEAGHELLEAAQQPGSPDEVAAILADRWPVRLEPDRRRSSRHGWTLSLFVRA
jgi:cytoplasmic iron level regulating protein YaaA (DUF328/UPF0246 family)